MSVKGTFHCAISGHMDRGKGYITPSPYFFILMLATAFFLIWCHYCRVILPLAFCSCVCISSLFPLCTFRTIFSICFALLLNVMNFTVFSGLHHFASWISRLLFIQVRTFLIQLSTFLIGADVHAHAFSWTNSMNDCIVLDDFIHDPQ